MSPAQGHTRETVAKSSQYSHHYPLRTAPAHTNGHPVERGVASCKFHTLHTLYTWQRRCGLPMTTRRACALLMATLNLLGLSRKPRLCWRSEVTRSAVERTYKTIQRERERERERESGGGREKKMESSD